MAQFRAYFFTFKRYKGFGLYIEVKRDEIVTKGVPFKHPALLKGKKENI